MTLQEFRELVADSFGPDLQNATPANVQEFVARFHARQLGETGTPPTVSLDATRPAESFEAATREFFWRVLNHPADEAVVALWLTAVELSFAAIAMQVGDTMPALTEEGASWTLDEDA